MEGNDKISIKQKINSNGLTRNSQAFNYKINDNETENGHSQDKKVIENNSCTKYVLE